MRALPPALTPLPVFTFTAELLALGALAASPFSQYRVQPKDVPKMKSAKRAKRGASVFFIFVFIFLFFFMGVLSLWRFGILEN
jgi:hypothetical protein